MILRQLPRDFSPKAWGMDPATTRMEIWTEFFDPPAPEIQTAMLSETDDPVARAGMAEPDFTDQSLNFGKVQIGSGGKAFADDAASSSGAAVQIGKSWQTIAGRTLMIEAAQYPALQPLLEKLPETAAVIRSGRTKDLQARSAPAATRQALLAQLQKTVPGLKKSGERILMASTSNLRRPGVVLDSGTISGSPPSGQVFRATDTTYCSGITTLSGTTLIEGGTVIKFAAFAQLKIAGYSTLICSTFPFKVAVLTAKDDNSVGEPISGSRRDQRRGSHRLQADAR